MHAIVPLAMMDRLVTAVDDDALAALVAEVTAAANDQNSLRNERNWAAIHRCLTDGTLSYDGGEYPLNHVICGGLQLHLGTDRTIALVTPVQVEDVARALDALTEDWFKARWSERVGEGDPRAAWKDLLALRELYAAGERDDQAVLFTVEQGLR